MNIKVHLGTQRMDRSEYLALKKEIFFIEKRAQEHGNNIYRRIFSAHCCNHLCGVSVPHVPFIHERDHKLSSAHEDKEEEDKHKGIFRF